jgi:hypothetical protein
MRCAVWLVLTFAPSIAMAQSGGARALGSPVRAAPTEDDAWGEEARAQDITPSTGTRRFADGHAGDVSWSDPELDLRPEGVFHVGMLGGGGVITGTSHTSLQPDLSLGLFVDVAIVPSISVHVRLAGTVHGRFLDGSVTGADGRIGHAAIVTARVQLLGGVHLWQLLSLRAGFELGASDTLDGTTTHAGLGWALVSQIGVRLNDGGIEIVIEPACDAHELTVRDPTLAGSWGDQPSLRLSLLLAGTF